VYDDKPHHECGIFGIFAPNEDVARMTFFGLYALQHRGQESAGIAVADGRSIHLHKDMGLVAQVFTEEKLRPLHGHVAIGHTRYSTTGSSKLLNAQPFVVESALGPLAIGHNGNLTNGTALRNELFQRGFGLSSSSDSELIVQLLAGGPGQSWDERINALMNKAQGAFCLTILTRDTLYALRDPWGVHPLCLGQIGEGGWVVASESCALATIGAVFIRELDPGEVIAIDAAGPRTIGYHASRERHLCLFEYIYFARPDSQIDGRTLHAARVEAGRILAQESPIDADIVIPVPDSGIPAAIGFAQQSGIPYSEGLIKNRYIGRTFIQPDDRLRKVGIQLKFNPLADNLDGKRVIIIDDSIVRGNTSGPMVRMLRSAGAKEVHMRVSSPPIKHPCYLGVDMATYPELIAHRLNVPEICAHLGLDSLAYLSLDGLQKATRAKGFCHGCFTGKYPVEVSLVDKHAFENR